MRVLVTGAGGFLGSYVVKALLRRGHDVQAMVHRPPCKRPGHDIVGDVTIVRADLRNPADLVGAADEVDVVVHLAAVKAGSLATQFAVTVKGTENLLAALVGTSVRRVVHISSFAVYDAELISSGARLDESSPVIDASSDRDEYAHAKRVQERIVREHSELTETELLVLRPGIVYGPGELWHGHLGVEINDRFWLRIGSSALVPITYVENCAEAIALAVGATIGAEDTFNIVDDDLPTQRTYRKAVEAIQPSRLTMIPVPLAVARTLAWFVQSSNRRLAVGGDKPPGLFRSAVVDARFKRMRYPNDAAKRGLGWRPQYGFEDALRRSASAWSAGPSWRAEPLGTHPRPLDPPPEP